MERHRETNDVRKGEEQKDALVLARARDIWTMGGKEYKDGKSLPPHRFI